MKEDAYERSGRIFLGEKNLSASHKRLEEQFVDTAKQRSFSSNKETLMLLALAAVLAFVYFSWPSTVEVDMEERLQQAIQEPLSLVALGEHMASIEKVGSSNDHLHTFKKAYGQHQYEEALDHFLLLMDAKISDSSSIPFHLYLADLYLKLGRYDKAIAHLQNPTVAIIEQVEPDIAYCATYYRGLAYLALGDQQEASNRLKRSVQQGGRLGKEAKELLRYLE